MRPEKDLFDAIKARDVARIRAVLEEYPEAAGAKDAGGVSAILTATYHGLGDAVDLLVKAGARVDVFEAAATGDAGRLAELIQAAPSIVHAFSADGYPLLGLAAYFGHPRCVDFLLERGADVNAASKNGLRLRPLHGAAAHGDPSISIAVARKLVDKGADVNVKQAGGWTPLHQAAASGNLDLARMLVERGAKADAQSDDGKTPLQMAVEKGRGAVAEYLSAAAGG